MNDLNLISREALKESLEELKKSPWYCEHRDTIDGIASYQAQKEAFAIIEHEIDKAPALIKCGTTPEGLPLMDLRPHPEGEWIPVKIRPLTDEEREELSKEFDEWEMPDGKFDCRMPEHGQRILITTKWSDDVDIDVCDIDPDYGIGLEERGDWDGVLAWMPVPEPYKKEEEK